MAEFSAFTDFGHLEFSSRPPHGELIYEQMVSDLGSGQNYDDDFDGPAMGRLYADAMVFADAKYALERAGSQFNPLKAVELLPALESEYGLAPDAQATIAERQRDLAAAMRLAGGASRVNVETVLEMVLGDDFVEYETVSVADTVATSADPGADGIYVKPGTPRSVFRLLDSVLFTGTPVTVAYETVIGETDALATGDRFALDAGDYDRHEVVTVTSVGEDEDGRTTITATFERPHTQGVLMATGRHPYLGSTKRHNVVKLTESGMATARTQARANRALGQLLRGVSTWALTDSDDAFTVGEGLLGVTLIGEDDLSGDPIPTGMVLHWDMQDPDSYEVTAGTPDRVTEITNLASSATATAVSNGPEFESLGWGGGLHCMKLNGSDMRIIDTEAAVLALLDGTEPAYTVYMVVEPLAPDAAAAFFGVGHSAKGVNQSSMLLGTTNTGNGRLRIERFNDSSAGIAQESSSDVAAARQVIAWVVPGTTASAYVNDGGSDPTNASLDPGDNSMVPDRFALGCRPSSSPGAFGNFRFAELRIYSAAHNDEQQQSMSEYLMSKWAV